jgi:signal transduction histidine kinase
MRLNSLYTRLSIGLVLLVLVLGSLYVMVMLHAGRLYFSDLNQQLNRELAANLIAENGLHIDGDDFGRNALEAIFHTYMVINPSIEVYLIGSHGRILAYSAPPGEVKRKHIDLAPLRTFLRGDGHSPIVGDDPRDPLGRKVFSAAPIGPPERPQGYLYVVLAGQQLESAAKMLQGSYILRVALHSLVAVALASVVTGLLFLRLTTRRLRRLDDAMGRFEADGFTRFVQSPDLDTGARDEIGRLSCRFARMAERITSQLDALRQSDALRRELVANVSHDLRTPIASLQGYLETLLIKEDSLSTEQRRDYLAIALRHGERLGRLVTELFELAKLDSGHTELNREPFAPGELVQDVVLKYRLPAQREGVSIRTHIPPDLPFVDADIGLIERVLENLLDNAIRHTPQGGQVSVTLSTAAGRVNVQVADTGCGIPAEKLPLVFDRFYQGHQGDEARAAREGIGLGLAIAKRILDLHASTIAVDSAPQTGTRFDFWLPACA